MHNHDNQNLIFCMTLGKLNYYYSYTSTNAICMTREAFEKLLEFYKGNIENKLKFSVNTYIILQKKQVILIKSN